MDDLSIRIWKALRSQYRNSEINEDTLKHINAMTDAVIAAVAAHDSTRGGGAGTPDCQEKE